MHLFLLARHKVNVLHRVSTTIDLDEFGEVALKDVKRICICKPHNIRIGEQLRRMPERDNEEGQGHGERSGNAPGVPCPLPVLLSFLVRYFA